jgi:hypothetical protein
VQYWPPAWVVALWPAPVAGWMLLQIGVLLADPLAILMTMTNTMTTTTAEAQTDG